MLTRFNALLGALLVIVLIVGPIQDALLGGVLIANTLIGIVQEALHRREAAQRTATRDDLGPRGRVRRSHSHPGDPGLFALQIPPLIVWPASIGIASLVWSFARLFVPQPMGAPRETR